MAQTILIKRSTGTATPGSLTAGELAYSDASDKLFIGAPADAAVTTIGGKVFMDMLDHTAGTLTASSALIVDSNSKIDQLLVDNMRIGTTANTIDTSSGTLTLAPAGNLVITHGGTVDLSAQANEITIPDNQAAAFEIKEKHCLNTRPGGGVQKQGLPPPPGRGHHGVGSVSKQSNHPHRKVSGRFSRC